MIKFFEPFPIIKDISYQRNELLINLGDLLLNFVFLFLRLYRPNKIRTFISKIITPPKYKLGITFEFATYNMSEEFLIWFPCNTYLPMVFTNLERYLVVPNNTFPKIYRFADMINTPLFPNFYLFLGQNCFIYRP